MPLALIAAMVGWRTTRPDSIVPRQAVERLLHPQVLGLRKDQLEFAAGKCCAVSFTLSDEETSRYWPAEEGWYLAGIRFLHDVHDKLLLELIDGCRDDRQIGWTSLDAKAQQVDIVVAFRFFKEPAGPRQVGELLFGRILDGSFQELSRFSLLSWCMPKDVAALKAGWHASAASQLGVDDRMAGAFQTWSWNGEGTGRMANPLATKPWLGSVSLVGDAMKKLAHVPLTDWPQPVWFLRVAATTTRE